MAKGVVYVLFGVTAVAIATRSQTDDEASPQGALGAVMDLAGGRLLVAAIAVGLFLSAAWRIASVVVERGSDTSDWLDRIGFACSAGFYVVLAVTAVQAAISNVEPGGASTVETVSARLLDSTWGRWLLGVIGVGTIAVGAVFAVKKGARGGFTDDLRGVDEDPAANAGVDRLIHAAGRVGWIGRGDRVRRGRAGVTDVSEVIVRRAFRTIGRGYAPNMSNTNTDQVKGRVKEAAGALTDDDDLKREGETDQQVGDAKSKVEDVADKVKDGIDDVRRRVTGD